MVKLLRRLRPPGRWEFPVILLLGIMAGIVMLLVYSSRAHSYLSDDPETCINCHVMYTEYNSWIHSSHKSVAVCNDCHVPHDNVLRKYAFKAMDGLRHATIFTARMEPQVIHMRQAGINVVQENCIRCHRELLSMVSSIEVTGENHREGMGSRCWDCHRETPHGSVRGLATSPDAIIPQMKNLTPDWLRKQTKK